MTERRQDDQGHDEDDGDGLRVEPVVAVAFFEEVLQSAEPHHEQSDPPPIDLLALRLGQLAVLRDDFLVLMDEGGHHREAEDPDRDVDVENPGPRVVVHDVAAQRGTDGRAQHDGHREERHGHPLLFGGEGLAQNGLFGWL